MQEQLFKRKNEDKGNAEWVFDLIDKKEIEQKYMDKIKKVKTKLWQFHYNVEDYSEKHIVDFDLLVEKKYKVVVGNAQPFYACWVNIDVYAQVDNNGITFWKENQGQLKIFKSPYDVFGRKKNETTKKNNEIAKG